MAELLGIFMGDGHVGLYQASVGTNSETDFKHALYVKNLVEELFHIHASLSIRRDKKVCVVVISSKEICRYLVTQGIPLGNKITLGLRIPAWIQNKNSYKNAFVRGLFDTDGCVYLDTHQYKNKTYKHLGMAFANQSEPLLMFFKKTLESIGLHPTQKTKFRVFLRRKEDIWRYFNLIGSSNEKHFKKVHQYFHLKEGGVA